MKRAILILITGLITSLFLFPFNLPVSITVNTKLIISAFGVVLFIFDKIKTGGPIISREFLVLSLICAIISIWAFFITVVNGTSDYAFARYLISVWIWLGGAYAVVWLIKAVHGRISVEVIGNYMIAVCVAQCLLAYSMTIWPSLGRFVDSLMGEGQAYMSATENRLHGLGAALDPAGLRFSAVLVILAVIASNTDADSHILKSILYFISFVIIVVFGNMISRTTTVGAAMSIMCFIVLKWPKKGVVYFDRTWRVIGIGLLLAVVFSTFLYKSDISFRNNIRFGFEGFFSLVEKGRWDVSSNEILKGLIVWPESLKTWIIGDGFFDNPKDIPDRFGQLYGGFYMKTDIGYLRYIFYFGCIGLVGMIVACAYITKTCIRELKGYSLMFFSLFLITLIGWLKVSSDVIMVFAPFLVLAYIQDDESVANQETV